MIGLKRNRPNRADRGQEIPQTWPAVLFGQVPVVVIRFTEVCAINCGSSL